MKPGAKGSLLAECCERTRWPDGDFLLQSPGVAEQILTVQRGRPPSAPAFSCSKGLSAGWGLPGEGTADWEPSRPLWLALLKICQILQCKKKKKRRRKAGKKWGCAFSPGDREVGRVRNPSAWCPTRLRLREGARTASEPPQLRQQGGSKPTPGDQRRQERGNLLPKGRAARTCGPTGTNTARSQGRWQESA